MGVSGVGYEGQSIDSFVALLRIRGVQTLVDVRLNAISRKRGFAKRALGSALQEAGIAYLHRPVLGNYRDNRPGYAELDTLAAKEARARYREALETADAVACIRELAALANEQEIALLCFEADERHCHREQTLEAVRRAMSRLVRA